MDANYPFVGVTGPWQNASLLSEKKICKMFKCIPIPSYSTSCRLFLMVSSVFYVLFCFDLICFDLFYFVLFWFDLIWFDLIWFYFILFDLIWFDLIWFDLIWFDLIRFVLFCFVLFCFVLFCFVFMFLYNLVIKANLMYNFSCKRSSSQSDK